MIPCDINWNPSENGDIPSSSVLITTLQFSIDLFTIPGEYKPDILKNSLKQIYLYFSLISFVLKMLAKWKDNCCAFGTNATA